ncbi:MAG: hypothetical protein JST22_14580 [Bacteroidetes bacterium]|nr:hypothetical protein [Bacteroidota bacterium]
MKTCVSTLPARIALLTILLCAFCAPALLRSQSTPVLDPAASGTLYYVAFPDTTSNVIDPRYPNQRVTPEVSLFIFSAVNTHVRITAPPSYTNTVTLQAGTVAAVTLPANSYVTTINNVATKVYRVQADDPIVLYCYMATTQGAEAWTPAPVSSWGKSYRSASIQGETVQDIGVAGTVEIPSTPKGAPAEMLVLAAYDSTVVTLSPPRGVSFAGNPPLAFTLNAGQAFQVQSRVTVVSRDTVQDDIAGTRIMANHPIGVISGNTRTQTEPDNVIGGPGIKGNIYRAPLFEWLSPAEEYGTRFVYLPTWDSHRSGIGSSAERLREHVRIYNDYDTTLRGSYYMSSSGAASVPFVIPTDSSLLLSVVGNTALLFTTDGPAQAFMHSSAIIKFEGSTPCYGGVPCTDWSGWAPYMAEMTPREQWTSFAPYYAPVNPGNMLHYINVVADTVSAQNIVREDGSTFPFTRRIAGTDLIWGSMAVSPGGTHWLRGRFGARFAGVVYGLMQGEEAYRPSAIRKKDDGSAVAGGGSHAPGAQAAEYEEYNAVSYGYPLAPRRNLNGVGDTMKVDTTWNCETLAISVRAISANPVGLRWVEFEDGTAVNATIVGSDPPLLANLAGRTNATVLVKPVDRSRDASGIVDIIDRTGHAAKVLYIYQHDALHAAPAAGVPAFGNVEAGDSASANVAFTNNTGHAIHVREVKLQKGIHQFTITSATPAMPPLDLAPGQALRLVVKARPDARDTLYSDSIICRFGCDSMFVPLRVTAAEPCVAIGDLVFGTFRSGAAPAKALSLAISNHGNGVMTFHNPVVVFSDTSFSMPQSERARLLPPFRLAPGENTAIDVTFTPPSALGSYRTVATFFTDATCGRDSSIWSADVVASSSVNAAIQDARGYRLTVERDGDANAVVHYALPGGVRGSLHVYDGNGMEVPGLAMTIEEGGERIVVWNTAGLASGLYYCVMTTGSGSRVAPFVIVR